MMMKMLELFNVPAAGGPDHYHTLYPHHISSDLLSLAGRMQSAEDRGELEKLGLDPALIEARQALIAQGVIGDFRTPDIARFGLTPLTLGYEDVWQAARTLGEVMDEETWRDPRHARGGTVT